MADLLIAGSTCNPDFDFWVVGTKTGWTPVKNLTFSVDANWSEINQKYSGAIFYPGNPVIAKPSSALVGPYDIKNQGVVSVLVRAQRNW
jgi:hypothetical protein